MEQKPMNKEIVNIDPQGNVWKLSMNQMETKTNRYELTFSFNGKEFSLCKMQNNRSASNAWELLELLQKRQQAPSTPDKPIEAPSAKGRPTKRSAK